MVSVLFSALTTINQQRNQRMSEGFRSIKGSSGRREQREGEFPFLIQEEIDKFLNDRRRRISSPTSDEELLTKKKKNRESNNKHGSMSGGGGM